MRGYNSLLGSHYDEYQVGYSNFRLGDVDDGVFSITSNLTCRSFPGPGRQHVGEHDPAREFIHGQGNLLIRFDIEI